MPFCCIPSPSDLAGASIGEGRGCQNISTLPPPRLGGTIVTNMAALGMLVQINMLCSEKQRGLSGAPAPSARVLSFCCTPLYI